MPSADQIPVISAHSRCYLAVILSMLIRCAGMAPLEISPYVPVATMLWPMWVVLIAGSTGSALRAVRPPNRHITLDARCDLVQAASAAGSL
jgi:branched-subunit amino acid permease